MVPVALCTCIVTRLVRSATHIDRNAAGDLVVCIRICRSGYCDVATRLLHMFYSYPSRVQLVLYSWFTRLLLVFYSFSTRILFVFLVITDDTKPSYPEAT